MFAGCATPPPPAPKKESPDLLSFLADGKTTKAEVINTFGEPSGQFEAEKILTYRLIDKYGLINLDKPTSSSETLHDYFVVERKISNPDQFDFNAPRFSLVLVFDNAGVLRKHSLVKVNQ